jgi:hypothetical protein
MNIQVQRWDIKGSPDPREREMVLSILLALLVARHGPVDRIQLHDAIDEIERLAPGCGINITYQKGEFAAVHLCRVPSEGPDYAN